MSTSHFRAASCGSSSPVLTKMGSNAQLRKIKKPLIERRRRERINECLVQLKTLVLEAMNKDESRHSKMEKADILEMTVTHLKAVQQQVTSTTATAAAKLPRTDVQKSLGRYLVGFSECANEVSNFLKTSNQHQLDDVRLNLMTHLEQMVPEVLQSEANFSTVMTRHCLKSDDTRCSTETLSERSRSAASCDGNDITELKLSSPRLNLISQSSADCRHSSSVAGEWDVNYRKQGVSTDSNFMFSDCISGLRQQQELQDSLDSSHRSVKQFSVSNGMTRCFPDYGTIDARRGSPVRVDAVRFASEENRLLTYSTNEVIATTGCQSTRNTTKCNDVTVDVWRPW